MPIHAMIGCNIPPYLSSINMVCSHTHHVHIITIITNHGLLCKYSIGNQRQKLPIYRVNTMKMGVSSQYISVRFMDIHTHINHYNPNYLQTGAPTEIPC